MRYLAFTLATVLSVVAIAGQWLGWPRGVTVAAVIAAGACLVWGFAASAKGREPVPKELDDEQRATIRRMREEGNTPLAVQQVQLWFRNTTPEEAAAIVREA